MAVTWDAEAKRVHLVNHKIFQPTAAEPLDFEGTIEATLLDWSRRYHVSGVRFDPYQMVAVAQRLERAGLPMEPFLQTVRNLTEASTNLYDLVKGRCLVAYPDDALRLTVSRAVALETSRGWRITKEKASHKYRLCRGTGHGGAAISPGGEPTAARPVVRRRRRGRGVGPVAEALLMAGAVSLLVHPLDNRATEAYTNEHARH